MKYTPHTDLLGLLLEKSKEAYLVIKDGEISSCNPSAQRILDRYFHDHNSVFSVVINDEVFVITSSTFDLNLHIPFGSNTSSSKPRKTEDKYFVSADLEAEKIYDHEDEMLFRLNEIKSIIGSDSKSEQFYFNLFNTISEGIFIHGRDNKIFEANEGAVRMSGYSKEFLIGKKYIELGAGNINDLDYINNCIQKAFDSQPQQFEYWAQRSNGVVFPVDVRLYKSIYFGQEVLIILATDITERKRSEAQIEAYTLQLQEVNETRDKYYSIIAHDLRSSFSSILGLSELLTEDWDELEESRKHLFARNIFIAADNSYKLLQNLLDWAKHQSGVFEFEPVSFDLIGSINEISSLYRLQALRKDIQLISEIDGQAIVYADLNMVQSVLRNLISNAIKFSPFGGKIVISAQDYTSETNREMLAVSITDEGVGISQERLLNIFEPQRIATTMGTDNEIGTGLGLLLCKEMTEQNQGKLWIKSVENEGSIFTFTIPKTALKLNN
jgi:PAS domain S-box-containing protein